MRLSDRLRSIHVPSRIKALRRPLPTNYAVEMSVALNEHYFRQGDSKRDMSDHVSGRLFHFRDTIVPWIDAIYGLKGRNILEIGTGTGASTLALAEQGAIVTGIDIDEGAMSAARKRLGMFPDLQVELVELNAEVLDSKFAPGQFEVIIFFAALEHMLIRERLKAIRAAWNVVAQGGLLIVVDTPNRLWWFDDHTAKLPFFEWLPDDLAIMYMSRSSRNFAAGFKGAQPGDAALTERLWRIGRGASFHEFELALDLPASELSIASDFRPWLRLRNPAYLLHDFMQGRLGYSRFLRSRQRGIPKAFSHPVINVAIRKDG